MRKFKYSKHSAFSNLFNDHKNKINMISGITLLLISTAAYSADNPFETPADFTAAKCPSEHMMYYMGANAPTSTTTNPVTKQTLSWGVAGTIDRSIIFEESSGNKTFKIQFSGLKDLNNDVDKPPFFGPNRGVTSSAINLEHNSPVSNLSRTNHILDVTVDRNVSKIGYKIQDLDSTTVRNGQVPYIEQADVSLSGGQLTSFPAYHDINNDKNIVTALRGRNCDIDACTISATWPYKIANTAVNLKHNNFLSENNSVHAIGYSDFYFCLAPPKVLIKKQLSGARINDTDSNRDQFSITINDGATAVGTFDTLGSGKTVTNNSGAVALTQSTTYTITERVINSQNDGDIANYNASYTCSNATTGSKTAMPKAAMTYDAAAKTRSFTLANTNYGDEITCTITNTPSVYTFLGTVFNDNGGLTLEANEVGVVNSAYFNGKFDSTSGERGISNSNLTVSLTDCSVNNNLIANTSPQLVSGTGQYNFYIPKDSLAVGQTVCLVENEPTDWEYSVDTTTNKRKIIITNGKYVYDNLDFGEVKANNSALVLIKSQYVHDCNATLNYSDSAINQTTDNPRIGFSDKPVSDVAPNQCIAYRIEAYNRGHVALNDVQITDPLQSAQSSFSNPIPKGVPINIYGTTMPTAKVITSNKFNLAGASSSATKATLYFNTKYGTTVDP